MKKLLPLLLLFSLCVTGQAGSVITATITVTNTPANGDTITINGSVRTWATTVATPSSDVLIGASIGANATNLYNQFASTPFTTLLLQRSGTNGVILRGIIDQALTVSIAGTWGEYALSTNTTTDASQVQVPASSYATQSKATNIISQLVSDIATFSTNAISDTAKALENYVSLDEAQTLENKTLDDATFSGGSITNTEIRQAQIERRDTNNGIYFQQSGGSLQSAIAPDANGYPSLYLATALTDVLTNALNISPSDENIINAISGDFRYGRKSRDNSWTGTNTFTRITNSTIVGSTLTGSTYSGTIGSLTNGTIVGSTITGATVSGDIGLLSGGYLDGVGATNLTGTNTVLKGITYIPSASHFQRTAHTSLANGPNSDVEFGEATFITIEAGPTAAFSVAGIETEADGRTYYLINTTGQNMTISHDSGSEPTPAQRIYTMTAADLVTTGNGMFMVWYDSNQSRWWAVLLAD